MTTIHLLERNNRFKRPDKNNHIWESGDWKLSEDTVKSLVGGKVYFHKGQLESSFFGGTIIGYRMIPEPDSNAGRCVIIFEHQPEMRGVIAGPNGWGNEKKIVP
jgi:hypothetical protein